LICYTKYRYSWLLLDTRHCNVTWTVLGKISAELVSLLFYTSLYYTIQCLFCNVLFIYFIYIFLRSLYPSSFFISFFFLLSSFFYESTLPALSPPQSADRGIETNPVGVMRAYSSHLVPMTEYGYKECISRMHQNPSESIDCQLYNALHSTGWRMSRVHSQFILQY
jgi:hypothetical protein